MIKCKIINTIKNWWWEVNHQEDIRWSKEFSKEQFIYQKYITKEILEWISNTNDLLTLATAAYEANLPDIYPSGVPSKPSDWGTHGTIQDHDEIWIEHVSLSVRLHKLIVSKCNALCPEFYDAYRYSMIYRSTNK